MDNIREEIVKRLEVIQEQESIVRDELKKHDHAERFAQANVYVGRYFKEPNIHHENCVRCIFAYGIYEASCEIRALCVSYWKDQDHWFHIEYYNHFNPKQWDEEEKWIEITKEEYMEHYAQAQKRVGLIIKEQPINPLPSIEDAGVIAVSMSEQLNAQEQSFFIAGFQECIKYLKQ